MHLRNFILKQKAVASAAIENAFICRNIQNNINVYQVSADRFLHLRITYKNVI